MHVHVYPSQSLFIFTNSCYIVSVFAYVAIRNKTLMGKILTNLINHAWILILTGLLFS